MSLGFVLTGAVSVFLTAAVAIVMYIQSHRDFQRSLSVNPPKPSRDNSCGVCCGSLGHSEILILDCTHIFHKNCLTALVENEVKHKRSCPICRAFISETFIQNNLM